MATNSEVCDSNNKEEEEHLKYLIGTVFSLEEVVETILKFIPDNETLKDILTLRKVCQLWRKVCFNLMLKCDRFPIKVDLNDSQQLSKFASTFSSDCSIPISVKVKGEHWCLEQLNFFHEYSRNIVRVKLFTVPANDVTIHEDKYKIILPRLRSIHVVSPPDRMFHPPGSPAAEFIQEITNKLRHIQLKEFVVQIGILPETSEISFSDNDSSSSSGFDPPKDDYLPVNVTGLILSDRVVCHGYYTDFLSTANLPNLQSLYVKSYEEDYHSGLWIVSDDDILPVLNQFAANLVFLRFNLKSIQCYPDGGNVLKIPKFPLLETLKLRDQNLAGENDWEPLSDYLPKLKNFASIHWYSNDPFLTFSNLGASNVQQESLKELSIQLTQCDRSTACNKKYLPKVAIPMESFFNTCPNVETLSVSFTGDAVASIVLQKVFAQLKNLRDLKITIYCGGKSSQGYYGLSLSEKDMNACYLLTGLKENEIVDDRDSWANLLEGNQKSISNLQHLRKLSLEYSFYTKSKAKWKVIPFVFYALMKIPNLKHVLLKGDIQVETEIVNTWREQSRSLTLPKDMNSVDTDSAQSTGIASGSGQRCQ